MVSTIDFNVSPYFDDFDPNKKFLRHLFRPGFAVQARELTQIQTILQNQVDRFGSHIFEDGSKVLGSDISDQNVQLLRIDPQFDFGAGLTDLDLDDYIGNELVSALKDVGLSVGDPPTAADILGDLKAIVFRAIADTTEDPFIILFLEYTSNGGLQLTDSSNYVSGEDFDDDPPETVTGQSSGATATVVAWSPVAPGNPGSRLYLKDVLGTFQDGEQVAGDTTTFEITIATGGQLDRTEFQPGDEIISRDPADPAQKIISKATVKNVDINLDGIQDDFIAVTGDAILASIDEGIFFVEGFFVENDAQRVVPFRLSALDEPVAGAAANVRLFTGINARIGFDISEDVVTSEDDTSLLDPAFGSPNFNAPGADRFRIQLLINFKLFEFSADSPGDYSSPDFVEWMRISQDIVVLQAVRPNYSALENELADRIEGIHGSFTVRAFSQDIRPHLKADLWILDLTSVLGTFAVGDTITGVTSGATAQVDFVGNYLSAPTDQVEAIPLAGAFLDNETITAFPSGASGKIDPLANPDTLLGFEFREDTKGVFTLAQGGEEDKIAFGLEPGRAFVQGFDFQTLATEYVKIDKARDTSEVRNFNIFVGFGNFVLVESDNTPGSPDQKFTNWNTNFTIGNPSGGLTPVELFDSNGVSIGTSRVRQITQDVPGTYRVYLFDSVFKPGKTMADLDEIHDGATTLWTVKDPEGVDANVLNRLGEPATILFEGERNSLVFPVPVGNSTETFTETDWRSQQQFDVFLNASGIGNVSTTSSDIRFVGGVPTNSFIVSSANLIHYTVIDQSNGNIIDMSLPSNEIQTNNGAPASNGNVILTVGDDGTAAAPGSPIASTNVTLIATLEIDDDPIGDEPLIRRNKVLQKNVEFVGIGLEGEVILEGNLSDTLTQGETLTVTSAPATASEATVDFTNDTLTALIVFSFTAGGLNVVGGFVEGETATALGGEIAIINCNTLIVDAQLSNVTASFRPGEVLFEGTLASPVALAVAITPTRWEITFGMFTDNGLVEGAASGESANIAIDPVIGDLRSQFTAAIFDYDASTVTGVLSITDTVTMTSTNEIEILDVIEYRGKILIDVLGDVAQRTMSAGDNILGGGSSATGTIKNIRLIGIIPQSDIFGVVSIEDQGNANAPVSQEAFFMDDGQRDNLYDFATAEYDNRNAIPARGPFTFVINHFEHTGSGPFYVNSYTHPGSNIRFENIPLYTSPQTGVTVALRDSIDFRPVRVSADPNVALSEAFFPKNGEAFDADYSFHLPRIDKIILRREQEFDVLRGIPSLEAQIPPDDPEALTLYVVKVPEYTYNAADIQARYVENKRYTMSDIGDIDRRVERLEYYTSLSLLERETDALSVPDATGEDRFKNGILVDSFIGHSVGDVLNPDYDCAMDFEQQHLRPPFIDRPVELTELTNNGFVAISSDGIVTLPWQSEALVFQPLASTAISVNPFNVVNWMGALTITPSSDTWIDVDQRPELRVNLEGENDAWSAVVRAANGAMPNGNGTQWGSWEQNWAGRTTNQRRFRRTTTQRLSAPHQSRAPDGVMRLKIEQTTATIERTTEVLTGRETRRGITTRVVPERIERSLGNRIVDVSIIQFIRARGDTPGNTTGTPAIIINAESMKPNTRVFPFFDDTLVSVFCTPSGGAAGDPILTDAAGKIVGLEFAIPAGRFRTGDRLFRLTDESSNIVANSLTSAEASWNAMGLLQTREETIVSTRVPVFRRQSVTQSRPARDVRTRDRTVKSQTRVRWVDPLAQTFLVDSNLYPNGVFLTSLDLFFRAKDATIPVTIQIRPVVNGFPHSSAIVPFSEITLEPAAVNTSEAPDPSDSNTATTFAFTSPVHLSGGQEYAVVILSNSNEYLTYIAVIGENQLGTEDRISMQPYAGSMFRSQNASTWTPDQTSDLMFVLNRAKFDTVNTGEIDFRNVKVSDMATPVPSSFADEALVNEMFLLSSQLEFPDSELNLSVDIADDDSGILTGAFDPILANQRQRFADRRKILMTSDPATFVLRAQFISNDDAISPVLDQDRLTAIVIENRINDSLITDLASSNYNGELEPQAFIPKSSDTDTDNNGGLARYISRLVTLQPGFESTDLRVFLTVNKEIGADVQVFVKVQTPEAEGDFNDERFVQLFPVIDAISENEEDFREIEYQLEADFAEPFSKFTVKIVLYSTDFGVTVPRVRDLRAIAVI